MVRQSKQEQEQRRRRRRIGATERRARPRPGTNTTKPDRWKIPRSAGEAAVGGGKGFASGSCCRRPRRSRRRTRLKRPALSALTLGQEQGQKRRRRRRWRRRGGGASQLWREAREGPQDELRNQEHPTPLQAGRRRWQEQGRGRAGKPCRQAGRQVACLAGRQVEVRLLPEGHPASPASAGAPATATGVFAAADIPAFTPLAAYGGELVDEDQCEHRNVLPSGERNAYVFGIDTDCDTEISVDGAQLPRSLASNFTTSRTS
jgi:hypothetical protein